MKTIFLGLILVLINSYLFAQNKFVIGFALKPQITSIIGDNEFY